MTLDQILGAQTTKHELKIKAAYEKGTLNGFKVAQRYTLVLMMASASKIAMNRYAKYAPQPT
jgi:hypothetical protein